jgi:low affinity Fe/Cu permease
MFLEKIGSAFTKLGVMTAHPATFILLVAYALLWLLVSPATLDFHAGAVLATWMMTLFIQRATHRDTQALQGKLDELLKATSEARTELAHLDEMEPEEIAAQRENGT